MPKLRLEPRIFRQNSKKCFKKYIYNFFFQFLKHFLKFCPKCRYAKKILGYIFGAFAPSLVTLIIDDSLESEWHSTMRSFVSSWPSRELVAKARMVACPWYENGALWSCCGYGRRKSLKTSNQKVWVPFKILKFIFWL